jgi:hypothetical protein
MSIGIPIKRGKYELWSDGTYRDPGHPDEWRLSAELIKLLHDAGWLSPPRASDLRRKASEDGLFAMAKSADETLEQRARAICDLEGFDADDYWESVARRIVETHTDAAAALNRLADYYAKIAAELKPWIKRSLLGPKVIKTQIDVWQHASELARHYADAQTNAAPEPTTPTPDS